MPLSEYEQRVLEELERDLGADPKLKKTMARAPKSSARVAVAFVAVVAGLALLLTGVIAQKPVVGVIGFVFMLGTVVWALFAPAGRERRKAKGTSAAAAKSAGARGRQGFIGRLEARFERRREQGDL